MEDGPGGELRLVGWISDLGQLARLFERLVSLLPEHVEILMKIEQ